MIGDRLCGSAQVIKSGYLNKQGKGFMGGWNRRWFVLDSSGALRCGAP